MTRSNPSPAPVSNHTPPSQLVPELAADILSPPDACTPTRRALLGAALSIAATLVIDQGWGAAERHRQPSRLHALDHPNRVYFEERNVYSIVTPGFAVASQGSIARALLPALGEHSAVIYPEMSYADYNARRLADMVRDHILRVNKGDQDSLRNAVVLPINHSIAGILGSLASADMAGYGITTGKIYLDCSPRQPDDIRSAFKRILTASMAWGDEHEIHMGPLLRWAIEFGAAIDDDRDFSEALHRANQNMLPGPTSIDNILAQKQAGLLTLDLTPTSALGNVPITHIAPRDAAADLTIDNPLARSHWLGTFPHLSTFDTEHSGHGVRLRNPREYLAYLDRDLSKMGFLTRKEREQREKLFRPISHQL